MIRLSFIDKWKSLMSLMSSSWFFILLFIGFIVLSIFLFKWGKTESKKQKKYFLMGYGVIVIGSIVIFHETVFSFLDHFVDNIVLLLCFPSMAFYIAMILFLNVVLLKTIFNQKIETYIKGIHITVYALIHFLFILIVTTISKNNIDIFNKMSIYTDKDILNLIEISMGIIVLWGMVLGIIKLINTFSSKEAKTSSQFYLDINPTLEPIVIGKQVEENKPFYPKTASLLSVEPVEEERLTLTDYKKLKKALTELVQDSK